VREIAAAVLSATLMGVGLGSLFRLPAPPEPAPDWSYAVTGDEDPNVTLYRTVMGSDPPTAPQPYVPIPMWSYSEWIEPGQEDQISLASWTYEASEVDSFDVSSSRSAEQRPTAIDMSGHAQHGQQAAGEPALNDAALLARRETYPTPYGSSELRLAAARAVDAAQEAAPGVAGVDRVAEPALSWGRARDFAHQGAEGQQ